MMSAMILTDVPMVSPTADDMSIETPQAQPSRTIAKVPELTPEPSQREGASLARMKTTETPEITPTPTSDTPVA